MPPAPRHVLRAGPVRLELGGRPLLMGVVNASPDSFSDAGATPTLEAQVAHARALLAAGADVLDVGGESGATLRPPVPEAEERARVVPLVRRLAAELGAVVSVDTHKPAVAAAAVDAGAVIVNDVSGLRDPALADVCAASGAALVVMHTRAAPKERRQDPALYDGDVVGDVLAFLGERLEVARGRGVPADALLVDPGPDFAKTPAQTIALLRGLDALHALGHPLLLAVSRKDFLGALTGRPPRRRDPATLAALAHGVAAGAHVLRVHDVAGAADFLRVRAVLSGEDPVAEDLALGEDVRRERPVACPPVAGG